MLAGLAALTLFIIASWIDGRPDFGPLINIGPPLLAMIVATLTIGANHRARVRAATRETDPRVIPHLLEVLDGDDFRLKREIRKALVELLPRLEPHHSGDFDARSRGFLVGLLSAPEPEVRVAAIDALAVVGQADSLDGMEAASGRLPIETEQVRLRQALGDLRHRLAVQAVQAVQQSRA